MIKGIIFDCFGVLYGDSLSFFMATCPRGKVEIMRDLSKQSDYGMISGDAYIAGVADILGKSVDEIKAILAERRVRNQPLFSLAEELHKTYKIGLVSNVASDTMDALIPPHERAERFDAVILSFEESIAKPNPAIFRLIAERLGLSPDECVMIDDLEENCDGAEITGMHSIFHTNNEQTMHELRQLIEANHA